jgi:1-acyl-sn-glycerol-3-phosphate acyltransferase
MAPAPKAQSLEGEAWAALLKPPDSYRAVFLALATLLLITLTAAVMSVVGLVTLFRARRLYTEVMARGLARAVLWLWGIRVVVHSDRPFPETQTIYISNHPSTIDVFLLVALGLPRTRFFWTGFFRKLVPLGVISTMMGTFHTPSQDDRAKRVSCFQRADRILRRSGDSVYLSPEGQRITTGRIGHFNKGAFHLATSLGVPILPLYIDIPPEIDPGKGYAARPGTVHVHVLPEISTAGWRLEDLERNRDAVRDRFVAFQRALRAT